MAKLLEVKTLLKLPESEVSKLQQQLEDSRLQNRLLKNKQRSMEDDLDKIIARAYLSRWSYCTRRKNM